MVYIVSSEGTRFIGDNIDRFEAGELILIGSNLPHMYQNDGAYFEPDSEFRAEAYAIHFDPLFLKTSMVDIPKFSTIYSLIERSKLGLKFSPKTVKEIGPLIISLASLNGLDRMLGFLKILGALSKQNNLRTIASPGFVNHFDNAGDFKIG